MRNQSNSSGLSLLETMVSMGIMGGLITILMSMSVQTTNLQFSYNKHTSENILIRQLNTYLMDSANCSLALDKTLNFNVDSTTHRARVRFFLNTGIFENAQIRLDEGVDLPVWGFGIKSVNLSVSNYNTPRHLPQDPTQFIYEGDLVMQTSYGTSTSITNKEKVVVRMNLIVDNMGNPKGCFGSMSLEDICLELGGSYDQTQTPSCVLQRCLNDEVLVGEHCENVSTFMSTALNQTCPSSHVLTVSDTNAVDPYKCLPQFPCSAAHILIGKSCIPFKVNNCPNGYHHEQECL